MARAILALGGNIGDVTAAFVAALDALQKGGADVMAASSIYRTPPWGVTDQPDFLNMAVLVETRLYAQELLALCLDIERQSGRVRDLRWGPRKIDIDIVTYGDARIAEPNLNVPHPHAHERAFVLVPLAEIAPKQKIGDTPVIALLADVDASGIMCDAQTTQSLRVAGY